jgi:hypothetical protein
MMEKLPSSMMRYYYYYWWVLSDPTHAGFFPQNRGSDSVQINKNLLLFINILINSGSLCSKNIYQLLLKKMGGVGKPEQMKNRHPSESTLWLPSKETLPEHTHTHHSVYAKVHNNDHLVVTIHFYFLFFNSCYTTSHGNRKCTQW